MKNLFFRSPLKIPVGIPTGVIFDFSVGETLQPSGPMLSEVFFLFQPVFNSRRKALTLRGQRIAKRRKAPECAAFSFEPFEGALYPLCKNNPKEKQTGYEEAKNTIE